MKKIDKEALRLTILVIGTISVMMYMYLFIRNKTKDYVYENIKVDSIQSKIDDIDTTIDSIPFTYSDSIRAEYFKTYIDKR